MTHQLIIQTPIGILRACSCDGMLKEIEFIDTKHGEPSPIETPANCPILQTLLSQLNDYFAGLLRVFDIPIASSEMNQAQHAATNTLLKIPYGTIISYKQQAEMIGSKAYRVLGSANRKNKWPIIVPCHRVVRSNGEIGDYSGGAWRKKWLIDFEQNNMQLERYKSMWVV